METKTTLTRIYHDYELPRNYRDPAVGDRLFLGAKVRSFLPRKGL
jgi:hypothetical protein